jgi:penicillin-binding protein-related factor A (putative recombinase)
MSDSEIGKKAEKKIKEWLDRPEDGYSFTRLYDQLSGYVNTSRNICDFICYKYPYIYYIESKATWKDNFAFNMIQDHQRDGLLEKSRINGCQGWVIVLFASYQRAFKFNIDDIVKLSNEGQKSLNIKKIDKWPIRYKELQTVPNNRKQLLDYAGEVEDLLNE